MELFDSSNPLTEKAVATYEEIIQKRFPSVTAIADTRFADEYGPSICALGVPKERRGEFAVFVLDELAPAVEAQGFQFVGVISYSPEEAEAVFPEVRKAVLA